MSVVKTRGRPPKNLKLTTASITSNDSNHSTASKVKRTTRTNGHGKFELKSEDEIYNFDEASPKASKRNRNGANCKQKTTKYLDCASNSTQFGVNLDGLADWSTEVTFVDLHRRARQWIVDQITYSPTWGAYNQSNVTLRDDGYPQYLEIAKTVGTFMTRDLRGHHINGLYVCLYDGDGVLNFNFDSKNIISREAGRILIQSKD